MLGDLVEGLIGNWGRIGLLEYTNVPYLHPLKVLSGQILPLYFICTNSTAMIR